MRNKLKTYLKIFLLLIFNQCVSQQIPVVNHHLILTDGIYTDTLNFGLDPSATNGIDTNLGESELPPIPPTGVCDFRFIGTGINPPVNIGQGLKKDYRQGGLTTTGERIHRLKFQPGSGSYIRIFWNLPYNITGRLQDVILGTLIDTSFTGSGFYTIYNMAYNSLWFKVNYNLNVKVKNIFSSYPLKYKVYDPYPNPFNPSTNIQYFIPKKGFVRLEVFDVLGKEIETLVKEEQSQGNYRIFFDASNYPSGVYYLKFTTNDFTEIKRIVMMK